MKAIDEIESRQKSDFLSSENAYFPSRVRNLLWVTILCKYLRGGIRGGALPLRILGFFNSKWPIVWFCSTQGKKGVNTVQCTALRHSWTINQVDREPTVLESLYLDGNLEIGAHARSNLSYLICLRYLFRSRAVTNRIFFLQIFLHACDQHVLSYHVIQEQCTWHAIDLSN